MGTRNNGMITSWTCCRGDAKAQHVYLELRDKMVGVFLPCLREDSERLKRHVFFKAYR